MKKVLVTGACGYLGARLSKYLAKNGFRITAFDSFDPSIYSQWTSLMEDVIIGDIRDETTISNLIKKQFEIVINLISLDHNKSEDEPYYVSSINVMPTWNLLDKLTKNSVEKFIYFSTQQVLGKLPSSRINESFYPSPKNKYGLTHLLCEKIVNYYNEVTETKCINIRLSNVYGSPVFKENNCWWLVINDFCKMALKHGEIKLLSDGSPQRDFIHNLDICRAVNILIEAKGNLNNNIFQIATGETWAILELAHKVGSIYKEKYNKEIPIILPDNSISENPKTYQNEKKYNIDITKMKKLGFQPEISLKKGIMELFEYLNPLYQD